MSASYDNVYCSALTAPLLQLSYLGGSLSSSVTLSKGAVQRYGCVFSERLFLLAPNMRRHVKQRYPTAEGGALSCFSSSDAMAVVRPAMP